MAKKKNRGKAKQQQHNKAITAHHNHITDNHTSDDFPEEITLKQQDFPHQVANLLLMIGTKHEELSKPEDVLPQIMHYIGTFALARNFARALQADVSAQNGGTPRLMSRAEAAQYLKSKLTQQDPEGKCAQMIDLLLQAKRDAEQVKQVSAAIERERNALLQGLA